MSITAHYTEEGSIIAVIDGVAMVVPDDLNNRHRILIAEWEASGGTITPYSAPEPTGDDVNSERDRRIVAGTTIDGIAATGRDVDARNMMSLALAAQLRLASGDTTTLTTFRDGNNVDHDLTPAEVLSLWQQSATFVSQLYAASWALKAMDPIPSGYTGDEYWPTTE